MNENETCKGCLLKYSDNYFRCVIDENYAFKNRKENCPCQICLLKGICKLYCYPFLYFLYIALIKHYTEANKLKEKFYDVGQKKTSRENVLISLQYYRRILDLNKDGLPNFGITSRLIEINPDGYNEHFGIDSYGW